ncbi:MAG: phosphopentomutase [Clostridia bacterium]|nr:phosphopentomutase [Clostridia bacterium]
MNKKAILIVLDSVGIGALEDAAAYSDVGADTLGHIINTCHPKLPNLMALGLANIDGASFPGAAAQPTGSYGKLREVSAGKDTTTGHWEIAGVQLSRPFPTFPNGFPQEFIDRFERATGYGTLGNKPASGTAILDELGEEHIATGKLIVYTSADSVFQIAANEAVVPLEELYRCCEVAREMLKGELEVGRVIARPFVGEHAGAFKRTGGRRDYSAVPPETMCDLLERQGKTVYGVGKIEDIFGHRGITKSNHAAGNPACMEATFAAMQEDFDGLLFVNLVDFDMVFGHRRDVKGYAGALEVFDAQLPQIQAMMGEEDILILTADHGCDPCHSGTDHTREHTPLLVWGKNVKAGVNLGTRATYADISATILHFFGVQNTLKGTSFLGDIAK